MPAELPGRRSPAGNGHNVLPDDEEEALCVIYSINVLTTKC